MKRSDKQLPQLNLILTVNRHVFSPLVILVFGTYIIDTVTYPGFLLNNLGLSPTLFLILAGTSYCLLLAQRFLFKDELTDETKLALRANIIILPFLYLLFSLFHQLERNHYPNYVFSTFHLHLRLLEPIVIFSLFLAFLYIFSNVEIANHGLTKLMKKNGNKSGQLNLQTLGPIIFFVSLLFLVATQFYAIFKFALEDAAAIMRRPLASFEERKVEKFGGPYRTYQFISRHTPSDSVIAVPPQFTWGIIGNIGFSRYFLYPRFLIHPEDFTTETMPEVDYYVIGETIPIPGTDEYKIWPSEPVPAEEIILFDELRQIEERVDQAIFDPSDPRYIGKWGIIKVPPGTKVHSAKLE